MVYSIYCDESCHLEKDNSDVMVLGAISCPKELKRLVYEDIRDIKIKHGLSSFFEIKWTKVSDAKIDFYIELVEYFFNNVDLSFRGVVATNKSKLNHGIYNNGDHNTWYYKMYFYLLDAMIYSTEEYSIFIDVKDTRGGTKVNKLQNVLCNNKYDFNQEVIKSIKQIQSKESEILQITDLFIGALSFYHRGYYSTKDSSLGKRKLVQRIIELSKVNWLDSTSRYEHKFNLFIWKPRGCQ